jgi:hypothetical protein
LWNRIDQRVRNSRGQFASISHYIRWLIEQDIPEEPKADYPHLPAPIPPNLKQVPKPGSRSRGDSQDSTSDHRKKQ